MENVENVRRLNTGLADSPRISIELGSFLCSPLLGNPGMGPLCRGFFCSALSIARRLTRNRGQRCACRAQVGSVLVIREYDPRVHSKQPPPILMIHKDRPSGHSRRGPAVKKRNPNVQHLRIMWDSFWRRWIAAIISTAIVVAVLYIAYRWVDPLPPRQFAIAAGAAGSGQLGDSSFDYRPSGSIAFEVGRRRNSRAKNPP